MSRPPGARTPSAQAWIALLLAICLTAMAATVIWVALMQGTSVPTAVALDSAVKRANVSSAPLSAATYPAELLVMAKAVATFVAPAPTPTLPPSPTATPDQTPASAEITPVFMCGAGVPSGALCEWPLPTATPEPTPSICQTPVTGEVCRWMSPPSARFSVNGQR